MTPASSAVGPDLVSGPPSSVGPEPQALSLPNGLASVPPASIANRTWWLASFIIPGWSQLMLGRWSGFVWLALAIAVWRSFWLSALSSQLSAALVSATLAALLHLACTVCAARLGRRR